MWFGERRSGARTAQQPDAPIEISDARPVKLAGGEAPCQRPQAHCTYPTRTTPSSARQHAIEHRSILSPSFLKRMRSSVPIGSGARASWGCHVQELDDVAAVCPAIL